MADQQPLDINYAKLPDWLVDRRQVPSDWRQRVSLITAKAEAVLRDVPPEVLTALPDYQANIDPTDYALCCAVRDAYVQLGLAERTLLGGLKGPAAAWNKLCKAYERNNVWLAETARFLKQTVEHDVPRLKQAIAKAQQQITDLERRRGDYTKAAAAAAAAYAQHRTQLGIGPGPVDAELRNLAARTPAALDDAVSMLQEQNVQDALQYYSAFATTVAGASAPVQLDTLHQVAKGQTEAWTPIETVQQQGTQEDSAGSGATGAPDIDWGVVDSQAAEIDWDAALEEGPATEDQAGIVQQGPAEFIDWDISVEDGAAGADHAPQDDELHVTTQGAPCTASVAAVRLAEDAVYRACLTDDVLELVAFLKARLAAMQRSGSEVLPLDAPEEVLRMSSKRLQELLEGVRRAVEVLTGPSTQTLLLLKGSKQYAARMAQQLTLEADQEGKCIALANETEAKRLATQRLLMADAPQLQRLAVLARRRKESIEVGLSAALGGRAVHVGGGELAQLLATR